MVQDFLTLPGLAWYRYRIQIRPVFSGRKICLDWSLKSLGANRSQLLNAIEAMRLVAMTTRSKRMEPRVMVRYLMRAHLKPPYLKAPYLKPPYLMRLYLGNFFRALAVVLLG